MRLNAKLTLWARTEDLEVEAVVAAGEWIASGRLVIR